MSPLHSDPLRHRAIARVISQRSAASRRPARAYTKPAMPDSCGGRRIGARGVLDAIAFGEPGDRYIVVPGILSRSGVAKS